VNFWIIQTLNGVSFGMLLFLLAAGLSLIFGLIRVLNLAHGSFYLVGAYLGLTVVALTGSFLLALLAAVAGVTVLGLVLERFIIRRIYGDELRQALLTFGFLFMLGDLSLWMWGGSPQTLPKPEAFSGSLHAGGIVFPTYRLLVIVVGAAIGGALWWLQEKTRLGAMIRAGVDDGEMARGMGINTSLLFTLVFALGAALAAAGGVLGGVIVGVHPGIDLEVLLLAFVVIIIGGLGSLKGAFVGGLVVGLLDTFGKALFPELALFTVFAPMAIILAVRPTGLFGRA
jgi:branched-chain amino acid transport system permease protein